MCMADLESHDQDDRIQALRHQGTKAEISFCLGTSDEGRYEYIRKSR